MPPFPDADGNWLCLMQEIYSFLVGNKIQRHPSDTTETMILSTFYHIPVIKRVFLDY